jgi:hypothetical protein
MLSTAVHVIAWLIVACAGTVGLATLRTSNRKEDPMIGNREGVTGMKIKTENCEYEIGVWATHTPGPNVTSDRPKGELVVMSRLMWEERKKKVLKKDPMNGSEFQEGYSSGSVKPEGAPQQASKLS